MPWRLNARFDGRRPIAPARRHLVLARHADAARPHVSSRARGRVVEDGASGRIVETHDWATGAHQANRVIEVAVGDGARGRPHRRSNCEPATSAAHLSTLACRSARSATFHDFAFTHWRRRSVATTVSCASPARAAKPTSAAPTLLRGRQHADTTLVVEHAVPQLRQPRAVQGVLDERGRGVFQGKIIVRPHAQKTDGKMMTQALLLSDEAEVDNKPELEIFADDVLRPRRDRGDARRGPAVLSASARHSAKRGRGAADPGLRRRGDRAHRATTACARR